MTQPNCQKQASPNAGGGDAFHAVGIREFRAVVVVDASGDIIESFGGGGGGAGLTDTQLRAAPVPVSGPLTDAQLRASAVPMSVGNFPATQPVSGPLTDTQLRATGVLVTGTFYPATQPVSGSVGISGNVPVTGTFWQTTQPVSGTVGISGTVATTQAAPAVTNRSSGAPAAPAANAVICDSGAMAAGSYRVEYSASAMDTVAVGKGMLLEHRNAANGATTHTLAGVNASGAISGEISRVTLALNERIRWIAGTAAGAASSKYHGCITLYAVS